jgi:DNA gyrase/topoisomerase IV subunit B
VVRNAGDGHVGWRGWRSVAEAGPVVEPQFEVQTKTRLGNSEVLGAVESVINDKLSSVLEENPPVATAILEKALQAARARLAARLLRDGLRCNL